MSEDSMHLLLGCLCVFSSVEDRMKRWGILSFKSDVPLR
jgi:hypothetical protein